MNKESRRYSNAGAVLVELSIAISVLILLICGAIVVSEATRERTRVSQLVRAIGKTILRECSDEIRNAGSGIQHCLDESVADVVSRGQQGLGDFKIVVSVYDDSEVPAARVAFSEGSTPESTVESEQTRYSVESVSAKFSNVLSTAEVAVVIEVFAPARNILPKIQEWFTSEGPVIYEGIVL